MMYQRIGLNALKNLHIVIIIVIIVVIVVVIYYANDQHKSLKIYT